MVIRTASKAVVSQEICGFESHLHRMETIILPGYSFKNKDWAHQISSELAPEVNSIVFSWSHWENPGAKPDWQKEAEGIIKLANGQEINLLAKSLGTLVAMLVLAPGAKVNKLILCGVPVLDFQEGDDKLYEVLKNFPSEDILCIQNENDNHGSFVQVEKFLHSINSQINVISKSRDDHEYYYGEDFKSFLAPKS